MAFLIQVLLLLSYDPEDDIVENLEELRDATEALFFPTKNDKAANGDEEDGEEAEAISVLIDLLVTLLQKPSTFVRTTAERVFTAFSGEVKEQALQLLLDQISPDSTVEVEEPTAGSDDEAEAAAVPNGKSADDDDIDDDEDSDSGDEDDEDLGIDLDADPELRAKVEAALRGVGMAVDEDEDEDDEDDADGAEEEEEEILDDEQMLELDDQLAEIFRAKKAQSKGNKADQEAALNSRLKVLDLLEHFAKAQPGSILVVDTVLPLLNVARRSSSEDKELAAKAGRVLRGIVQKSKEYPSSTEVGALLPTLTAVHAAAQRASSPEALALASATSLYLCRIILGETGVRNSQEVIAVYQASLSDYLVRKQSRIQPKLFIDFIQRFKTAAWALKDALLVASSEQTTTKDKHKRCQALHLVAEVMAAHSSLVRSPSSSVCGHGEHPADLARTCRKRIRQRRRWSPSPQRSHRT
jgi:DNA polymerase phi